MSDEREAYGDGSPPERPSPGSFRGWAICRFCGHSGYGVHVSPEPRGSAPYTVCPWCSQPLTATIHAAGRAGQTAVFNVVCDTHGFLKGRVLLAEAARLARCPACEKRMQAEREERERRRPQEQPPQRPREAPPSPPRTERPAERPPAAPPSPPRQTELPLERPPALPPRQEQVPPESPPGVPPSSPGAGGATRRAGRDAAQSTVPRRPTEDAQRRRPAARRLAACRGRGAAGRHRRDRIPGILRAG